MANTKKYVSLEKLSLYNENINRVISAGDTATLDEAKSYANSLSSNYEPAGAIARAKTEIQGVIDAVETKADTAQAAADKAQGEVDALETLVGTLPEGTDATSVVDYIGKKTEGIATNTALAQLQQDLDTAEAAIDAIEADYLKLADKTELSDAIDAEAETARAAEKANADAIKVISDDYLKAADKTELQGDITTNAKAIAAIKEDVDAFFLDADMTESAKDTLKELQTYIAEDETGAAQMAASIKANSDAIDAVEGRLDTAEGKITTLEGEMDDAQAAILALQGAVGDGGSVEDMIAEAIDSAIETEELRVDELLATKVDKVEGKGLSTNDLTNDLKSNYDEAYTHSQAAHAPVDAQANVIESVKVNGTALTITGKAVDVTVPTSVSELTNDKGYLVAADVANKADKATTLAGYGIADAYTKTETDTAIANAVGNFVEVSEEEINSMFA